MPSQPLVWIHGDCLNPASPALRGHPTAPRLFVFDDELLAEYKLSFKRIVFIYECLLEIPQIEVRKGDVVEQIALAVNEHGCDGIVTVESVAPRFAKLCQRLRKDHRLAVEVMPLEPFVDLDRGEDDDLDLKRFSRYWQRVGKLAMRDDG